MSAALRFKVADIVEAGGLSVSLELEPAALFPEAPPDAAAAGPVRADLEFSLGTEELLLQARLAGAWRVPCARCLAPHERAYEAAFDETYPSGAEELDASDAVRESALLEIPQSSLCRDACKGLCASCGKDLNAGPCACSPAPAAAAKPNPFGVLKKLKEK